MVIFFVFRQSLYIYIYIVSNSMYIQVTLLYWGTTTSIYNITTQRAPKDLYAHQISLIYPLQTTQLL